MFQDATPCDGSPAILNEAEGTFGIDETQYENNMTCRWLIHVSPFKVNTLVILENKKVSKTIFLSFKRIVYMIINSKY